MKHGDKLVCINNKPLPGRGHNLATEKLVEGNVYTIRFVNTDGDLGPSYKLMEIDYGIFCASRFIPLSSIDETQFERNYKKELV